ncbi:MAG: hypothetical protein E7192_08735 [Erysipelotrichaceae bacterium]|nr:hypothetical protein [Erysipelotrichaceae bacterium]MBQ4342933.1 hypothetical protein [Erysipelotrichaceae bacterium]
MTLTLIICAIGIFVLVSTFFETRKYKNNMDELIRIHKCKEHAYYQKPIVMLTILMIVCLICAYLGFQSENDNILNIGLLLGFLFLAESYRSYFIARMYYNDEGFVANDRFVKFRSIKKMFSNSSLPFGKWTITTFSNEKITIVSTVAHYVENNFKDKLPTPKSSSK